MDASIKVDSKQKPDTIPSYSELQQAYTEQSYTISC